MKALGRSATEVSAVTAIAVGVSFIISGAYVSGIAVLLLGAILIGAYEFLGIENISISENQFEILGKQANEELEELEKDM